MNPQLSGVNFNEIGMFLNLRKPFEEPCSIISRLSISVPVVITLKLGGNWYPKVNSFIVLNLRGHEEQS